MALSRKQKRNLFMGVLYISPNMLGVLCFMVFPLIFSIVLAFTNWDLKLHSKVRHEPLKFVGFDNFRQLFPEWDDSSVTLEETADAESPSMQRETANGPGRFWSGVIGVFKHLGKSDFFRFLGNTLYLMIAIPFWIGGALLAAILLSKNTSGGGGVVYRGLVTSAVMIAAAVVLTVMGMGATSMVILMCSLISFVLVAGVLGGNTVYRTLFYMPSFTSGVAIFILWKNLYNKDAGPINNMLRPVLDHVATVVQASPTWLVPLVMWLMLGLMVLIYFWSIDKLRRLWRDGELGSGSLVIPVLFLSMPYVVSQMWGLMQSSDPLLNCKPGVVIGVAAISIIAFQIIRSAAGGRDFSCRLFNGSGTGLALGLVMMTLQFILLGLSGAVAGLPGMINDEFGLEPPGWIYDYHWAKPAMMIMLLWIQIGANNMLLYLAALSNVPEEMYEAADIDGASRFQKFWNVTWPQLAPTTFFIVIMSTIFSLQGGFEMAKVMTSGGPAGSTTFLSFYIYQEGFETGRLGYASAVTWMMFLMIFTLTMVNWKFGNQYVNE